MLCGLDQLFSGQHSALRRRLRSSRIGVLTHTAAVDRRGRPLLGVLEELGASPSLLFSPEHGLAGTAQAQEPVGHDGPGPEGQPPVISLYGETATSLSPSREHLEGLEVLVIDLVDVGSRYYTYVWTALLAVRAAVAAGVHCVLLDRPNPISGDPATVEGATQAEGFLSLVGQEPVPIRHALTIGEMIAHCCARDGVPLGAEGGLLVVPIRGWERHRTAEAWGRPFVMPSPNMPTLETALVYPGGCLVEGTNLSEGRGTTVPFQTVGAPWLDGQQLARGLLEIGVPGAQVRPVGFVPMFDKHRGVPCQGVMIHVTNAALFRPVATYAALITLARSQDPEAFRFRTEPYEYNAEVPAFDLLTGSASARTAISSGASPEEVVSLIAPADPSWVETVQQAEMRVQDGMP